MRPAHTVVGAWAAGNLVLALVLLAFTPTPLVALLYVASAGIVAAFGLAVLAAIRGGRVGVQQRQPRRATAAVFVAVAAGLGLTGLAYGWWVSALAVYPLGVAAWMLRGERLPADARPWPVVSDRAEPAGPPQYVYRGTSTGTAVPVPAEHAAHGAPAPPPEPRPMGAVQKAGWLLITARALVDLLRRRR